MKILAVDQASKTSGWAIFEDGVLLEYGKFTYDMPDLGVRLHKIKTSIQEIVEANNIDKLYLEDVQYQENVINNVQTFKTLAKVLGVLYEYGIAAGLDPEIVLAGTWKKHLGIKGAKRADQKRNAQNYVIEHYQVKPTQDECDAICIGTYACRKKSAF